MRYDALLLVSFGGPEQPADVAPFLANVTRGRQIPPDRLAEVAEHYHRFGGISPINAQNRALVAALRQTLDLPVYWGNRNWAPQLPEALRQMRADGVRRALAFVTSAFSSYSGCRQYRQDIAAAQAQVPGAPSVHKLRTFYSHPGFVLPFAEAVRSALAELPAGQRTGAHLAFTAHSVPQVMADTSAYVPQLRAACALIAQAVGGARPWSLAYNSRSGPAQVPWLEPDIGVELDRVAAAGAPAAVVVPVGFVSDHMEVVYDLDTVALPAAASAGLAVRRAATPGLALVPMIAALVAERTSDAPSLVLGSRGRPHDGCPLDCCPPPVSPSAPR